MNVYLELSLCEPLVDYCDIVALVQTSGKKRGIVRNKVQVTKGKKSTGNKKSRK